MTSDFHLIASIVGNRVLTAWTNTINSYTISSDQGSIAESMLALTIALEVSKPNLSYGS